MVESGCLFLWCKWISDYFTIVRWCSLLTVDDCFMLLCLVSSTKDRNALQTHRWKLTPLLKLPGLFTTAGIRIPGLFTTVLGSGWVLSPWFASYSPNIILKPAESYEYVLKIRKQTIIWKKRYWMNNPSEPRKTFHLTYNIPYELNVTFED